MRLFVAFSLNKEAYAVVPPPGSPPCPRCFLALFPPSGIDEADDDWHPVACHLPLTVSVLPRESGAAAAGAGEQKAQVSVYRRLKGLRRAKSLHRCFGRFEIRNPRVRCESHSSFHSASQSMCENRQSRCSAWGRESAVLQQTVHRRVASRILLTRPPRGFKGSRLSEPRPPCMVDR